MAYTRRWWICWGGLLVGAGVLATPADALSADSTSPSTSLENSVADHEARQVGRFPDDAIVRSGAFPGSITIPGTDASVRLGGFVRADAISDVDSLGALDIVVNQTIPLDGTPLDNTAQSRLSARNSRINFDVRASTDYGSVRTFIEADFLGGGSELTSGYTFQLRHAAAQFASVYFGQWWSTFDDVAALPEGATAPLGAPTLRQPGIHWADDVADGWRLGFGFEHPSGDLTNPGPVALASEAVPDVTAYVQLTPDWLRLRLAGLFRRLETDTDDALAGGVNLSGRVKLPFIGTRETVAFQAQVGRGFGRYYLPFAGGGLDGVVGEDGRIDPLNVIAGFVAYQHWWSDRWRSTVTASFLRFDVPTAAGDLFERGELYGANLFWSPVNRATFGIDLIYATQRTASGQRGSGLRLHATARIDFWAE